MSPVFVIGGLYKLNTPFFLGRIKLNGKDGEFSLDTEMLKDTMTLKLGENSIEEDTKVGVLKDIFKNEAEIQKEFKTSNIQEFFENLENEIDEYYK